MKKDWIEVELGSVLIQSKEKHNPKEGKELFYIGLEHIEKDKGTLTDSNRFEKITTLKNKFENGQILYGKLRPYLNKVYLAGESGVCSTDILVFQPTELVYPRFAHFFMLSRKFVNQMSENTSGVNLPRVSTSYINMYPFPLPPIPEQRAIVARIEELFSELDHSILNLQSALSKLEIYRQAVLKKAFEGGFTQGNIESGKFIINGISSNIPKSWSVCTLGNLVKLQGGFAFKSSDYQKTGIPIVKIKNVHYQDIDWSEKTFIKESRKDEFTDYSLNEGDILIAMTRPIIKSLNNVKTVVVKKRDLPALLNQRVGRFLIDSELNKEFLKYFIFTDFFKRRVLKESSSSQQPNISSTKIEQFDFILPCTLEEQTQIVQEIESRLSVADKMVETIQASLKKAEAMRQSILKKAFEGKLLTASELESCRKEADWEPAERLLERVKNVNQKTN